jgi:hypothetical protein
MINTELQKLADEAFITAIVKDDLLHKYADGSFMESAGATIKEEILKVWDKDHPIESVVSFIAPGMIWGISPWMAILYEVAGALGWNQKEFWGDVGNKLKEFLQGLKTTPSEQEIKTSISNIVNSAANSTFNGEVDEEKLNALRQKGLPQKGASLEDVEILKKFALYIEHNPKLYKSAGPISFLLSPFKSKIRSFFVRVVMWAISTAVISLGLAVGKGALATALHLIPSIGGSGGSDAGASGGTADQIQSPQQITSQNLPANLTENLLQTHENDLSGIWIENYSILNIENLLLSWVSEAYPQLDKSKLQTSNALQTVVNEFKNRNRLGEGTGLVVVPRGYIRKIDVAAKIATQFVKENPTAVSNTPYTALPNAPVNLQEKEHPVL